MDKYRKKTYGALVLSWSVFMMIWVFTAMHDVQAFELGKTYDQSNYREVQDVVLPPMLNWIKSGDLIVKTGELGFDFSLEEWFLKDSQKNADKFALDSKGYIIDATTKEIIPFIYGLPFPQVDVKDPKAGEKIMHNFKYANWRICPMKNTGSIIWIGTGGHERELVAATKHLAYQGRPHGPLPNPNNFLYQTMTFVVEPMDLRGTVSMAWMYNEDKEDSAFSYVPMLRRVRRTSAASRSDPFLGSDFITDTSLVWCGKNQTMDWNLLEERTILVPFTTPKKISIKENPDGSVVRIFPDYKIGYQDPAWKGRPWFPTAVTWHPREVYLVESIPRDPYYNVGKIIYYCDKQAWMLWGCEHYNRAGEYWKCLFIHVSHQVTPSGKNILPASDGYFIVDEKTNHATYARTTYTPSLQTDYLWLPPEALGPGDFTLSAMQQLSK